MNEDHLVVERKKQIEMIEKTLSRTPSNRGMPLPTLKAVRIMKGLSQKTLAEKIGGSQRTISELENQYRGAYPTTIRRLAEALEVAPAELIREKTIYKKESSTMSTTTGNRTDDVFYLEKLYRYKDPTDMEEFEQLMTSPEAPVHSVSYHDEYVQITIRPDW